MIHLIVGLITLILGAWGMIAWWEAFGEVLRGLVPIALVLFGLAAIGAGFRKTVGEEEEQGVGEDAVEPVFQGKEAA